MSTDKSHDQELHPLADLDRVIHSPARLMVMTYLYVVESVDYLYLMRLTGLTWGNLSSHLSKLEEQGYIEMQKSIVDKKPHTLLRLTDQGRSALREYKQQMQQVLGDLPD